ncbi:UpxY family transcription antiterminator [Gelidibacter salicanalis]|uniref:UpxY family transcription antiterminator n=1 Tax=Gelidibacter salicanalis TaxID=291193 RepID=A0A5C7AHG3_9FLAO|nr:UpxY family transcription antiterminator [Gelidibacter salicanalis]TXE07841.1 UpxY family transcription antiterminator [Gelidibacter salicanalis]
MQSLSLLHWHVLYVKHQHEKKVEQLLQEKNIEVFLPLIKSIKVWSDRKKQIWTPLFPRYIFVHALSRKEFYHALSTEGVIKYLKFGNEYAVIRATEIFHIKALLNIENISEIKVENNLPSKGQKMRISYGPLNGLDCEVIKVNNKRKIIVRIESIRHYITAYLPSMYLSPQKFTKSSANI